MSGNLDRRDGYVISFGPTQIQFQLTRRARAKLAISVYPNRRVSVVAPLDSALGDVLERVRRKAPWIQRQRYYFEQFQPLPEPKRYVSGETHHFLGRQYRLKVLVRVHEGVKLVGRYFRVGTSIRHDTRRIKSLLHEWYRTHARKVFGTRMDHVLAHNPSLWPGTPPIVIRDMTRRWGSCTKAGKILLNVHLVKTPIHCIDYVIAHELCHLRYHDHSRQFFRLLGRRMPDWEARKARLDEFVL